MTELKNSDDVSNIDISRPSSISDSDIAVTEKEQIQIDELSEILNSDSFNAGKTP